MPVIFRLAVCFFLGGIVPPIGAQTRPAESTNVAVAVTGGAGSGSFDTARTLHVWADPPGAGSVFDRWTGDTAALVDPLAEHTMVLASFPGGAVNLTATYRNAPVVSPVAETFTNGTLYRWYVPPGTVRGVVTSHHGTGGSAAVQFARIENGFVNREAAARGFAVVAIDSLNRVDKQWDGTFSTANPDVQNVLAILASLEARGLLPAGLPRYAIGMSNGGAFAPKMTAFGGFAAAASYCAQAANSGLIPAPVQWRMAMRDDNENVGDAGNDRALLNFGGAQGRGTPAAYERNAPTPLHPARFLRIAGLTSADGTTILNALRSAGHVDADNFLVTRPDLIPASAVPLAYFAQLLDIREQLGVVYSDHQFWADAARRTFDFCESPAAEAVAQNPRLINLSTRAPVQTGDNVLIAGFVVQGSVPKRVLVRAPGPSLTAAGVPGALSNPQLELLGAGGARLALNDDWATGGQAAEISATGLAPADGREPAIVLTLNPGAYTAIVRGTTGAVGVALVEAYDLDTAGGARLGNVSTRARVGTGDQVVIAGLVVQGLRPKRVVVRAIGPSLAGFGVSGTLSDPQLELRDAGGRLLVRSDSAEAGPQKQELIAARLLPSDPRESALIVWLAPGAYTAIVRGAGGTEGVALVEAYELP